MRRAEPVAGIGGLLLLVALFLPWYGAAVQFMDSFARPSRAIGTAWEVFSVIDVLLALLALLAIAVPIVSLMARGPALPVASAVIASALGWIAVLLVGFRLVDSPGVAIELRYGAWLALAGALIAWVGSWLSLRDESTPGAVAPDIARRPAPEAG
jgi:hypothetical protein